MGCGSIVFVVATWWPIRPGGLADGYLTRRPWSARFGILSLSISRMDSCNFSIYVQLAAASITPNITAPIAIFMGPPMKK